MKDVLSPGTNLEIFSYKIKREGPVKLSEISIDGHFSRVSIFEEEDEDDLFCEDELCCIFLFRNKRTAENVAEWLCRRYFERFGTYLEMMMYEIDLLPNRWGLFVRESYELDVKELIENCYQDMS